MLKDSIIKARLATTLALASVFGVTGCGPAPVRDQSSENTPPAPPATLTFHVKEGIYADDRFTITSDGKYLVVSHYKSDTITFHELPKELWSPSPVTATTAEAVPQTFQAEAPIVPSPAPTCASCKAAMDRGSR